MYLRHFSSFIIQDSNKFTWGWFFLEGNPPLCIADFFYCKVGQKKETEITSEKNIVHCKK